MAFGRPCRVIATRVHAEKKAIQDYEFQKSGGHRGETAAPISAASFGREILYRSPITSDDSDHADSDDSGDADSKPYLAARSL
jgi:hypothetical protein